LRTADGLDDVGEICPLEVSGEVKEVIEHGSGIAISNENDIDGNMWKKKALNTYIKHSSPLFRGYGPSAFVPDASSVEMSLRRNILIPQNSTILEANVG
jgi:hypothetical protein